MKITKIEASNLIERFVTGDIDNYEWDEFTNSTIRDAVIEKVRDECVFVRDNYPSRNPCEYCNEEGTRKLLELAKKLRE